MSNLPQTFTNEETIALILEKVKSDADRFQIRIWKRKPGQTLPENHATLTDATAAQIQTPEGWLQRLMGGGEFQLEVSHMNSPAVRIGGRMMVNIGGPLQMYPFAYMMQRTDWDGPPVATFLAGQGMHPMIQGTPVNPNMALQPWLTASQQNGVTMQQGNGAPAPTPTQQQANDSWVREAEARLAKREQDMREREEKVRREQDEKREDLRRLESENRLRSEAETRDREIKAQLATLQRPAESSGVEKLAAIFAPLAVQMMQQQAAARAEALKMQMDAQERADRRAEAAATETRAMFKELAQKPGMSAEMQMLIETLRAQAGNSQEAMGRYMEAMTMVSKQSVAMIETIADINLGGQPDHPVVMAIREGIGALRAMSTAGAQAQRPAVRPQALPAGYVAQATAPVPLPAPVVQPAPQAAPPAHFAGIDPKSGNGAVAVQTPAPIPAQVPAPAGPQVNVPVFNIGPDDDPVAMLEGAIRAHDDVNKVALFFIQSVKHPRMNAALEQFQGNPQLLLGARLGPTWLGEPANMAYIQTLGEVIDRLGEQYGLVVPDEDGEEDGDEPEDEPEAAAPGI